MKNVDFLIIGGGIAGTSAAEAIRSKDTTSLVTVLSHEANPLYSRVLIPHYIRGEKKRSEIFLRSLEDYRAKNIEYLVSKEVQSIDFDKKTVHCFDGDSFGYKKLLITTGGAPRKLTGVDNGHFMYTIEDADRLVDSIQKSTRGAVIGSGFIALELIESFLRAGLESYLGVSKKGFWAGFLDPQVSNTIIQILEHKGVKIFKSDMPDSYKVFVEDPKTVVGVGIGIEMQRGFMKDSPLTFDMGIVTDATLKTNIPDVYAAGDIAKFYSNKLGRYVRYGNWNNALTSGRAAGFNMLGENLSFDSLSSYSSNIKELNLVFVGFTGVDEKTKTSTKFYSPTECAQFFVREGKLDGCVLINRPQDRALMQKTIDSRAPFVLES